MEDTWAIIVDLPVLKAAVRYLEDHHYGMRPQAFDLAADLGLQPIDVGKALLRLDGASSKARAASRA